MQPLKLIISGSYWDSQIYSGRLYLFTRDARIRAYDWDSLIEDIPVDARLRLALECGFRRSDYLYGAHWSLVFSDPDILNAVVAKFSRLAKKPIVISENILKSYEVGEQDNPFPFPHADTTVYYRKMYSAGQSGIYETTCDKKTRHPVSTRPERIWDCPLHSISASYRCLAMAAGADGLWEMSLTGHELFSFFHAEESDGPAHLLAPRECDDCEWMFYSIYGTSYDGGGFLAAFEKKGTSDHERVRKFSRLVSGEEIFQSKGFSFGTRDKIYLTQPGLTRVVSYTPWDETRRVVSLGSINIAEWKGEPVAGGVASFGVVIEYDNALIVLPSDGKPLTIRGEPVKWRVFPRSKFYENHLHVIGGGGDYHIFVQSRLFR
jgi:hypothetical protein